MSSNFDTLKRFCNDKLSENISFSIPSIAHEKVEKCLKNIDITKATGTDNIGPRLLKLAAQYNIHVHLQSKYNFLHIYRGILLIRNTVGQGPTALAAGAGGDCLAFFLSSVFSLFFLPLSGRRPDLD